MKAVYFILISIYCSALICCTDNPVAGGAGGETTNGISGIIHDESGRPVANARIRLRSKDYLPDVPGLAKTSASSVDTKTNSNGYFEINKLGTGEYRVEASVGDNLADLMQVSFDTPDIKKEINGTLAKTATVSGQIAPELLKGSETWVQVYGSERVAQADLSGNFSLVLPEGLFSFSIVSKDTEQNSEDLDSIEVLSGDTVQLGVLQAGATINVYPSLSGQVLNQNSQAASGMVVRIIPATFNPAKDNLPTSMITRTDANGVYRINGIETGTYRVEVFDLVNVLSAAVNNVIVSSKKNTSETCTIQQPGSIQMNIPGDFTGTGGYIYLPGTGSYTQFNATDISLGYIMLTGVPAGIYQTIFYLSSKDTDGIKLIEEVITVSPDVTTIVPKP
ncbi:MAG: carboxypeptidase regulatory-like domain-containing protein [Fibrobacteria bacterium]|nr:carboxypeptidase regulatory-like domain-containing protein [Fibrobacteria bacterium]